MTVRLTRWGHACVRLDDDARHLVVDPGTLCELGPALDGADAILVTHEHGDHIAVDEVARAVAAGTPLWGPAAVVALLREAGAPQALLHAVVAGDTFDAGGFEVEALGERHAVIHPDIPVIPNVAYLVAGVLHPGDALVVPPRTPDVLLLPVSGPWFVLADGIDLAREVGARRIVPIHDGLCNDRGLASTERFLRLLVQGSELVPVATGESIELGAAEQHHEARKGRAMATSTEPTERPQVPGASDEVPLLELDETVPPRPEEEVADVARTRPDPLGHGGDR